MTAVDLTNAPSLSVAVRTQHIISTYEEDIRKRLADVIEEHQLLAERLRKATEDFHASGVGYASLWLDNTLHRLTNVRSSTYFRDLASENDRPCIYACEQKFRFSTSKPVIELRVPKTQRLGNIVAQLLLLAREATDRYRVGLQDGVLEKVETNRVWFFYFKGDDGKVLFEHWHNQCRTDPVFRVALKLPALATM